MTRPHVLVFLALALLGAAVHAQPAFLVKDIRDQTFPADWPALSEFVQLGGIAYFKATDPVHGEELWRSDGSEAGTWLLADLCPGICSSGAARLTVAGGFLFFGANDGIHGYSLWKTDGTAAGTVLVRSVAPLDLVELGGALLFTAVTPGSGAELWRSDGTTAGTVLLGDLWPGPDGSNPVPLGYAGNLLLFSAADPAHGRELWKTDGTAAGTTFLKDITPGTTGSLPANRPYTRALHPSIAGRLFFPASDRLWVSDGTPAGTSQVATVPIQATFLAALGSEIYFSGYDSAHGYELWKSDGTLAGTVLVKDLDPGSGSSSPGELLAVGGLLYLRAATPTYSRLWKSDGTAAGTVPVIQPGGPDLILEDNGYNALLALDDELVLFAFDSSHGREPWKSDGTAAGTILLGDLYPGGPSSFGDFSFPLTRLDGGVVVEGQWLFRALIPDDGWALWKSDGTPAGTQLVRTFDPIHASSLAPKPELFDFDGTLLFSADDGSTGQELWRSDGTAPGTSLVMDINPGSAWSSPSHLTRFGASAYFGSLGSLWRTDGTDLGTEPFYNGFRGELAVAGSTLYFLCTSGFFDALCKTDGSFGQTIWNPVNSSASRLTPAGSNLYFRGSVDAEDELWKTNGTPGDALKLEIAPGAGSSNPESITGFGSFAFLSADDGSTGRELWFSDGSVAGTRRVKDIVPGSGSSNPRSVVKAGDLVFFIADDGMAGEELWRSDGTAPGTFRLADIRSGPETSWIAGLTALGGRVLFAADDGIHGAEPWTSDGTLAGTSMVADIRPGAASSHPGAFRAAGHLVVFAADDGVHGLEPWKTDGTAAGTALLQDILPGAEPSSPAGFSLSGDYLYFTANDGAHGFELWALDRSGLGGFLTARKQVVSPAYEGANVTWEILVTNTGAGPLVDNSGDELVDIIPSPLTLVGASADSGTAAVDLGQNEVTWNGALAPGETATITIQASVPSAVQGQTFYNQATLSFDADGDGSNESAGVSDDPGRQGAGQPTPVVISAPPVDFYTLPPCRVFDTRSTSALSSGVVRTFAVAETCGVPAGARAVAANLTVIGASGNGRVVVYPSGPAVPTTSNLNFQAGVTRANNAVIGLTLGQVDALATVAGGGTVQLVLDITGYFQ
jgi:ELWxxDGT repeat protein